jgi:hypothetical protein
MDHVLSQMSPIYILTFYCFMFELNFVLKSMPKNSSVPIKEKFNLQQLVQYNTRFCSNPIFSEQLIGTRIDLIPLL